MADGRINQRAGTRTAANIVDTDVFAVDPASGGSTLKMLFSELRKAIRGGDITPGTALASAAVILDADKKVEGVGGIEMTSDYVPAADQDVATKSYLDDTRFNADSPVLLHREDLVYSDFISGTPKNVLTLAAGDVILGIYVRVKTGFTDTGTDLLDVGKTGTEDYFEADIDISSTGMKDVNDASFPYGLTSAESVTVTYTGANEDADAGVLEIYVHYAKF